MRYQIPAKSKSQERFFQWLAHNPEAAKEHGMKPATAKEYVSHNTGSMSYNKLPEVVKTPKSESFSAENVNNKSYNKVPEISSKPKRFHSLFNTK